MPEVRLCPRGYGSEGMPSKTEFEEIPVQFGILQGWGVSLLLLEECEAVKA